jgi:hypothetical protein
MLRQQALTAAATSSYITSSIAKKRRSPPARQQRTNSVNWRNQRPLAAPALISNHSAAPAAPQDQYQR